MTTYLSEPDELLWLRETHLKTCNRLPTFRVAVLEGNEDYPESITLYEADHIDSMTMTLRPDADGVYYCNSDRF